MFDNPAWETACQDCEDVTALFVVDPDLFNAVGDRRRRLLVGHLVALDHELRQLGGRLRIESGAPSVIVPALSAEVGANALWFSQDVTPYATARDREVLEALDASVDVRALWGILAHRPGSIRTAKGTLSQVFTPFYKKWIASDLPRSPSSRPPEGVRVRDAPGVGWEAIEAFLPDEAAEFGERAAQSRLEEFSTRVDSYQVDRDVPALAGTSGLAMDLHFGTISPVTILDHFDGVAAAEPFLRQLAWREWYAHLLFENPTMTTRALKPAYDNIQWQSDNEAFAAWTNGTTGFPIVDAGMRQLRATGEMHNRVRMIAASFLVKDLLIDWRRGERVFRRLLNDADVAQNVGNWQWVAGCGPDAAPYFRVFNPELQSRKFDPRGVYLRRWLPELAGLDDDEIHAPADVAPLRLAAVGIALGDTYPWPIVDHPAARDRALAAYKAALDSD